MPAKALPALLAAACLFAAVPTFARAGDATCTIATEEADPLADRQDLLAEYERLPAGCLQATFRQCTEASERTLLDLGSAAMCSIGYEALLRKHFGGDFHALMAWWRDDRPQARSR
jgi:hypothetical protein